MGTRTAASLRAVIGRSCAHIEHVICCHRLSNDCREPLGARVAYPLISSVTEQKLF
jgi:hypothetical protein